MASSLLQAVPGWLSEERNVCVHASSERVPGLGEDLAGLGDVHAVPPSGLHVRRGAVQDRLGARILALGVSLLDRLRGHRSEAMVFAQVVAVTGIAGLDHLFMHGSA